MAATQKMINEMYGNKAPDELTAQPHYKFKELLRKYPKLIGKKEG